MRKSKRKFDCDQKNGKPQLRLRVFGAVEAWTSAGKSILPRGCKAQAILAYLAMCGESAVPRRRLARLLWSTRWEEQARASLRQSLVELRRSIVAETPELLRIERDRVCLQIDKVWVDGIDIPAEADRSVSPPQPDTDTFLESLRGVDAAFDHWIDTQLATFKATSEIDSDCV